MFLQIEIYGVVVILTPEGVYVNGRPLALPAMIEKLGVSDLGTYISVAGMDGRGH